MILRVAAAVALAGAALALLAYLQLAGHGPFTSAEARHLREMKERAAVPRAPEPLTFAGFAALPHGAPLAAYAPLERRAVSLEGYTAGMLRATDGDYHLEIVALARRPGDRDTLYVTGEITGVSRAPHPSWRYEALRQALCPVSGDGPPLGRPTARVRISGWLLYDFQYDGQAADTDPVRALWNRLNRTRRAPAPGPRSTWPRLSGWEIHPVTGIEVWDDSRAAWRGLGP